MNITSATNNINPIARDKKIPNENRMFAVGAQLVIFHDRVGSQMTNANEKTAKSHLKTFTILVQSIASS